MIKHFNNIVVLTSQNPEAFLNFSYKSADGDQWIIPNNEKMEPGLLYVNGIDITNYKASKDYALKLDASNDYASFHVYTDNNTPYDEKLTFNVYNTSEIKDSTVIFDTIDVSIHNRPYNATEINNYELDNTLDENNASYLIMRSSPTLTGNIAIRIDTDGSIYLDTIKVSDRMGDKRYRKKQVTSNSSFSYDVHNVFGSLGKGEIYDIGAYDNNSTKNQIKISLKDQYVTEFNYGTRISNDNLYDEENIILAPLWINEKLPDFFVILKLPGVYNKETYDNIPLDNLATEYFSNSNIIKSWSLKETSDLGTYLHNHLTDLDNRTSPVFLPLSDLDVVDNNKNIWHGISIGDGNITTFEETTHDFNIASENITELNAFVTNGFTRNNILCPNLLNMEFMFTDYDASIFSMNRYFGLYVSENELYDISYYKDDEDDTVSMLSMDGKDIDSFIESDIFNDEGEIDDTFKNRLFVLNINDNLKRITHKNDIINPLPENINAINENIISSKAYELNNISKFLTFTVNNVLVEGEHLRVIDETEKKIWEIYAINNTGDCSIYCTTSNSNSEYTIFRTYFDVSSLNIEEQVKSISEAFDRFNSYESESNQFIIKSSKDSVSILIEDSDSVWNFQRLTASILNVLTDINSGFINNSSKNDLSFFGVYDIKADNITIVSETDNLGPTDFEIFGRRQSIIVPFIDLSDSHIYKIITDNTTKESFKNINLYQNTEKVYKKLLKIDIGGEWFNYVIDPISLNDNIAVLTKDPVNLLTNNIFNIYSIQHVRISLLGINPVKDIDYTIYDDALGVKSNFAYKREDDASTYNIYIEADTNTNLSIKNSFIVISGTGTIVFNHRSSPAPIEYSEGTLFNTFDTNVDIFANTDTVISYSKHDSVLKYDSMFLGSEENFNDYKTYPNLLNYNSIISNSSEIDGSSSPAVDEDSFNNSIVPKYIIDGDVSINEIDGNEQMKLNEVDFLPKYNLIIPSVIKWSNEGKDCRGNNIILKLDNNNELNIKNTYIPTKDNFSQEISYPSFKYLSNGSRAWESYIFYDINDVVDTSSGLTIRDAMISNPYIDYFSKLLYTNYNVHKTTTRSTLTQYNDYDNSISAIITGIKLKLKIKNIASNIIKTKSYNKYNISLISTPSRNRQSYHPVEIIINENTKTILLIWYQGNDILNYTVRGSSYLPGKAIFNDEDTGIVPTGDTSTNSYVKTPFFVNNSSLILSTINTFSDVVNYNGNNIGRYAQYNERKYKRSIWNAPGLNNTITGQTIHVDSSKGSYNTFENIISYLYEPDPLLVGLNTINNGYNYDSDRNWFKNNTTNYNTLEYIIQDIHNMISTYIIRDNKVYSNADFNNRSPITVELIKPKVYNEIVTHGGNFKPRFKDMLFFSSNENKNLNNIVKKDFVLSNTNIKGYDHIDQLWRYRVYDNNEVARNNNIDCAKNFNIFKTSWDANYYFRNNESVHGFVSSYELPSFFGSKVVKIPKNIIFDKWDGDDIEVEYFRNSSKIKININITDALKRYFRNSNSFTDNWNTFTDQNQNINELVNSYIEQNIITKYDITSSGIDISIYKKIKENGNIIAYEYDDGFNINTEHKNIFSSLESIDDKYVYSITVNDLDSTYYFKMSIKSKKD